jgi:hypothetical protein
MAQDLARQRADAALAKFHRDQSFRHRFALSRRRHAERAVTPSPTFNARAAVTIAAAALAFAVTAFAPQVLNDGDTYLHIAAGRRMIADHAILFTDPFSYTAAGMPWDAHEWLAEILMAASFAAGGWNGLLILFGLAAAATAGALSWSVGRHLAPVAQAVATVLAMACMTWSLLARPHLLAMPLLAIWVAGLVDARSRNAAPTLWLLPLMALWVNLHGSFLLGLGLAGALALEALLEDTADRRRAILGWGPFVLGAGTVSLLNPHLLTGVLFPLSLMGTPNLAHVGEWQAMDLSHFQPAIAALAVLIYLGFTRGARLSPLRTMLVLGLAYTAIQHQRHQIVAAIAIPMLVAEPFGAALGTVRAGFSGHWSRAAIASMALALGTLTIARAAIPPTRGDAANAPREALRSVPATVRATPVLNDYSFGGYLIFAGVRPFIDSRVELYGDAALRRYAELSGANRKVLGEVLRRYGIRWSILNPASPMVGALDATPGWHRVYSGRFAVVHIRDSAAH